MPKFRLLQGGHIEAGPKDPKTGKPTEVSYRPGDVFDSKLNLDEKFNQADYPPKFERIFPGSTVSEGPVHEAARAGFQDSTRAIAPLKNMTVHELKKFAEEEEIDLKGVNTQNQAVLLKHIETALLSPVVGKA